MYDAIDDPYTYENSTVLVNKQDLRNQDELGDFEAEISSARANEPLPDGELEFAHFCAVHHHLFQDVYEWAGTPRTVRLSKQGNPFCFPKHIVAEATNAFRKGNGRTQLSFFALLTDRAGHPVDLEKLDPDTMLNAMIASFDGDETELAVVIGGLIG